MPGDLTGVELKLRRAETHLAHLNDSISKVLDPDIYSFSLDYDAESGDHLYRVHHLPPIPTDWSLIAGEILFNLRSALDHLAWQLVILEDGEPGEHTKFPIHKSPLDKNGNPIVVNLNPPIRDPKILQALSECQPYVGPTGEMPVGKHPLYQLNLLNNIDKHRLLLVVAHSIDVFKPMYRDGPTTAHRLNQRLEMGPLIDGSPVARFDFQGADPPADFDPHITIAVVIDDPEVPQIVNVPIGRLLETFCWYVRRNVIGRQFGQIFGISRPWGI